MGTLYVALVIAGKIRRATPDFVCEHTGQQVGGVAPAGHPRRVRTIVDFALAAFTEVWAGGGDEFTMFATSFAQLLAITGHGRRGGVGRRIAAA